MATDIKLDTATHDLLIVGGELFLFQGIKEATVQKLKINLLTYRGEWFRDISIGVPYLQDIFGKKNTQSIADTVIKNTIINTDNIASIFEYSSSITDDRKLTITFSAVMKSGGSVTIENLEV